MQFVDIPAILTPMSGDGDPPQGLGFRKTCE